MSANGTLSAETSHLVQRVRDDMGRVRGRLLTLVEATGMPPEQQDAFKGLIRTMTYDCQRDLESALRGGTWQPPALD